MKKYIYYICLLLVAFVHAQEVDTNDADVLRFEKGAQFLNLNLSLNHSNEETILSSQEVIETKRSNITIRSSYAYAISDNFFLGLGLGYVHSTSDTKNGTTNVDDNSLVGNTYTIFPYARYYKGIGEKLAVFLQGEASYRHSNIHTFKSNNFSAGLRPGITFMMDKNLALEASVGFLGYFSGTSEEDGGLSERDNKGFRASLNSSNLLFGLNYYF
ncbi:outer membrane beta-barrel protein [uncultured Kordia sp.]|uniref:outer membrane beta-barrel protein n=1 Tax=uncultured Kordia sp. TaxID=507699 RepID=UPI0026184C22|nr:outer membrane beta-barrel protein [uncultured Kordia sp.]